MNQENENTKNGKIIGHLMEAVLHSVFVGTMFKIHREMTINKLVGLRDGEDEEGRDSATVEGDGKERESTIVDSLRNKTIECKCLVCNRMIAAIRFAPHLEKCIGRHNNGIGIGRNTRTRRRANNPSTSQGQQGTSQRTTRSSTLRSAARSGTEFEAFATEHPLGIHGMISAESHHKMEEENQDSLRNRLRKPPNIARPDPPFRTVLKR